MYRFPSLPCKLLFVAAAGFAQSAAADATRTTPDASEMSQSEWRHLQLQAADQSDKIMRDARKQSGLLAQYLYMQAHYDANHERAFQIIFGQYLSWFQTFIGDYDGAAASFSIAQPAQPDDARTPLGGGTFLPETSAPPNLKDLRHPVGTGTDSSAAGSVHTGAWRVQPAADVILELAKDRKAVFFNEAHSVPLTRTLTIELLAKLRAEGFNYFAAETLYRNDKALNQRGYPTPDSGFYIDEPLYGEMVRTALKLGFKVVAYDVENAGAGDPRELSGAQNLYHVFKQDPNARLIVDAGFAHIQKTGKYLGGSSMAEFFEKMSGIDPLCIEQTMMIQHARPDQDHPYYTAIVDAFHMSRPIVFVDGKQTWTLKPKEYDLSVVFPPSPHNDLRPDWLSLGGLRVAYPVAGDICRGHFPCLIEARYANEGADAVAADRTLLNVIQPGADLAERVLSDHGTAKSRLFLRPGKYRITAVDRSNHVQTSREVTISASAKP
ncbi:MAG TPA: hypothetical protein VFF05_09815 [Rudaea sp.]|jgi:hypothetical protein|nr:hypothetical protein [Rudaea sp.]